MGKVHDFMLFVALIRYKSSYFYAGLQCSGTDSNHTTCMMCQFELKLVPPLKAGQGSSAVTRHSIQ